MITDDIKDRILEVLPDAEAYVLEEGEEQVGGDAAPARSRRGLA